MKKMPLTFVLSVGADPLQNLLRLAKEKSKNSMRNGAICFCRKPVVVEDLRSRRRNRIEARGEMLLRVGA